LLWTVCPLVPLSYCLSILPVLRHLSSVASSLFRLLRQPCSLLQIVCLACLGGVLRLHVLYLVICLLYLSFIVLLSIVSSLSRMLGWFGPLLQTVCLACLGGVSGHLSCSSSLLVSSFLSVLLLSSCCSS